MKRFLCLWFPNWPVQSRLRFAPADHSSRRETKTETPLILHAPVAGKPRVTACSRSARKMGVRPGMLLAEAEALTILPSPGFVGEGMGVRAIFEPHDPYADRETLRQLALQCQRFTPLAAVEQTEAPDSVLLDVTGCGYGFGGLEGLAVAAFRDASQKRERFCEASRNEPGYSAIAALADTVGAAWAVAHHGVAWSSNDAARVRIVPPGEQEQALRPLPIEALRLPAEIVELLHDFDIRRIEQLLALPRRELPCRFGAALLHRLDQALGVVPELIEPEPQDEPISASWPFEPPIADHRLLDQALSYLLDRVLERLQPHQHGVQQMLCSLTLANGEPLRIPVGLVRPSANFAHLIDLLRLNLERVRVTGEIAEVTLDVPLAAPLEFQQDEMFEESLGAKPLAPLLERLSSRLGETAVLRPELRADAQPEYGWEKRKTLHHGDTESTEKTRKTVFFSPCLRGENSSFRPSQLQRRPVAVAVMSVVPGGPPLRFEWNARSFSIAHAWGPERIETGWWRGDDVRRDYYQVETASGERFWLFRRLPDERWFLHGVFS